MTKRLQAISLVRSLFLLQALIFASPAFSGSAEIERLAVYGIGAWTVEWIGFPGYMHHCDLRIDNGFSETYIFSVSKTSADDLSLRSARLKFPSDTALSLAGYRLSATLNFQGQQQTVEAQTMKHIETVRLLLGTVAETILASPALDIKLQGVSFHLSLQDKGFGPTLQKCLANIGKPLESP